jgi:hypothetical protein
MADQMTRLLNQVAMARQINGMAQRHGYVHEVKEGGGERKIRLVLGFNKNGEPWLSPWLHTEEHRGGSSSQQLVEKGQAMVMTCHGGSYRNATCSPSGESESNPQPPHAPQFNGDTTSNGSKVRTASNKPSQQSGGGTSLLGTAEVLTPTGFKSIRDIALGDKIVSYAVNAGVRKNVEDTVVGLHAALTKKQMYDLNYAGGRICCTFDHEIWTETRNQYVATDKLGFVDKVRGYDSIVAISSLVPREPAEVQVFDLTVASNANFYVRDGSSGDAILVHNANGGGGGGGKDTHSIWIDNQAEQRQQHQEQTGQYESSGSGGDGFGGGSSSSSSQQGGQGQQSSNKPDVNVGTHLNDDGSFTARNGTECRVMVAKQGSKLKTKQAWAVVTKDGKHIIKKPWIIGKDPFEDNDSI